MQLERIIYDPTCLLCNDSEETLEGALFCEFIKEFEFICHIFFKPDMLMWEMDGWKHGIDMAYSH